MSNSSNEVGQFDVQQTKRSIDKRAHFSKTSHSKLRFAYWKIACIVFNVDAMWLKYLNK